MKPRETAFALFAVLVALAAAARDRVAYEWQSVSDTGKVLWIVGLIIGGTCFLIWASTPFVNLLMFIN